jgi:hypothetical protein
VALYKLSFKTRGRLGLPTWMPQLLGQLSPHLAITKLRHFLILVISQLIPLALIQQKAR